MLFYPAWRKQDKGGKVTSSCVHWGHVLFQGYSRSLLFFCYFMVSVFLKCHVMICIVGTDPKKIWHATLVSRQKKRKWGEVGTDEEKRAKAEGSNLSSSHEQKIAWMAGSCLCPHWLQCIPWWMGHLIQPCFRVLLERICRLKISRTALFLS